MVPIWNYNSLRRASSFIDLIGCIFIDKRDPTLFAVVVWALWKRRNNPPLGKSCGTLGQLLTQAKKHTARLHLAQYIHGLTYG